MSQVLSTLTFVSLSFVKSHKTVGRLHPRRTATDLLTDLPFCLSSFNVANWQRLVDIYYRTDYNIITINKSENYDSKLKQTTNWSALFSGYSVTKLIWCQSQRHLPVFFSSNHGVCLHQGGPVAFRDQLLFPQIPVASKKLDWKAKNWAKKWWI